MMCNDELNQVPMTHDWDTAVIHNQLRFSEKKIPAHNYFIYSQRNSWACFPSSAGLWVYLSSGWSWRSIQSPKASCEPPASLKPVRVSSSAVHTITTFCVWRPSLLLVGRIGITIYTWYIGACAYMHQHFSGFVAVLSWWCGVRCSFQNQVSERLCASWMCLSCQPRIEVLERDRPTVLRN